MSDRGERTLLVVGAALVVAALALGAFFTARVVVRSLTDSEEPAP